MRSVAYALCVACASQSVFATSTVVRKHVDYQGNVASFISTGEKEGLMMSAAEREQLTSSTINLFLTEVQQLIRAGTHPDKDKIQIIKNIVVEQLLPDLQASHKSAEAQVSMNLDAISTCNSNSERRLKAIKGNTEKAVDDERKEHVDCRAGHKTKAVQRSAACRQLDDFLDTIQVPAKLPEPRERGAMVTFVETMSQYFCDKEEPCTNFEKACNDATVVHDTHKGKCDVKQRIFESGYCTWKTELADDCKDLDTCYNDAYKAYMSHVNTTVPLVKKWKIEYAALKKIECYIDVWLNDGSTDTADSVQLHKCDSKPIDTTPMDLDFGAPADMNQCPVGKGAADALVSYPGKQSWVDSEYGNFKDLVADVVACD